MPTLFVTATYLRLFQLLREFSTCDGDDTHRWLNGIVNGKWSRRRGNISHADLKTIGCQNIPYVTLYYICSTSVIKQNVTQILLTSFIMIFVLHLWSKIERDSLCPLLSVVINLKYSFKSTMTIFETSVLALRHGCTKFSTFGLFCIMVLVQSSFLILY